MVTSDQETNCDESLNGQEAFFQAAANGEVATLKALLGRREELEIDVNGKNEQGYSAIQVAVLEGYIVVIKELVLCDVDVGDALLRAADVEFELAVKSILEYALTKPEECREKIINCHCDGSDFHPSLTPIIRAAQKNNWGIVKLLLDAGARIPETKLEASSSVTTDSLLQSTGLVERYRAIATPAYVTQAFRDPIDKAFKLTRTLTRIGNKEVEHKLVFQEMAEKMEQLAADLMSEARNTGEILIVLTYSERGCHDRQAAAGGTALPKIARAIDFQQKKFVAEPNCQHVVSTQFHRKLICLGHWPTILKFFLLIGIMFSHPVLSILYKLGVRGKVKDFIETPYVKFLMQLGSDIVLLAILLTKTYTYNETWEVKLAIVLILLAHGAGIAVNEILFLKHHGARQFFTAFCHYRDVVIVLLIFTECILQMIHISEIRQSPVTDWPDSVIRRPWHDAIVLSPAILGLITVIAFLRLMPYFMTNDVVGPFQISLGDMIVSTSQFFVFLLAVLVAFAVGMTYLYANSVRGSRLLACRSRRDDCNDVDVQFENIGLSTLTMYWSLFGLIDTNVLLPPEHSATLDAAGVILYVLFNVFSILILLNALIAVMSNVYNAIEENADVEWKFSRTALWMTFMDDTFTVPPPYNLIPDMTKVCRGLIKNRQVDRQKKERQAYPAAEEDENGEHEHYQRVINQLMERYVTNRLITEQSASSDIGPMDIRDLRNDLASLRFDINTKLCQFEDSIMNGRNQSEKIYGQSAEANAIFRRTIEIDVMVNNYKAAMVKISENVEKYKDILPALADLEAMLHSVQPGSTSVASGHRYGTGLVPSLVTYYEHQIIDEED